MPSKKEQEEIDGNFNKLLAEVEKKKAKAKKPKSDGTGDGVNDGISDGTGDGTNDATNDGVNDVPDKPLNDSKKGIDDGINDAANDGKNDGIFTLKKSKQNYSDFKHTLYLNESLTNKLDYLSKITDYSKSEIARMCLEYAFNNLELK